jgi:PAS domain S-box-containing protein
MKKMTEDEKLASEQELDSSIFRMFFDASPQGVLVINDGRIIYANKSIAENFGITPAIVIGKDVSLLANDLSADEREKALKRFMQLSQGLRERDIERFRFIGRDGVKRVLEVTAHSLNVSGKNYVMAYGVDVTIDELSRETLARERKAYSIIAEAALSTEGISNVCQKILTGLIETLGFDLGTIRLYHEESDTLDAVASVNIDTDQMNKSIPRDDPNLLVARTARTLEPLLIPDVLVLDDSRDRMSRAKELGIRTLIFWPIMGADNILQGIINIASRKILPLEEDDRIFFTTIAGMFATILERREAEEKLKESQEQFIAFTDNLPGPVFIKDHESRVLFVNQFMKTKAFNPNISELTNVDLFKGDRAKSLTEEDQKVLARGPIDRIQDVKDKNGKVRTFRSHKFPIFREGKPPLIGGFSLDITEQVQAEKQSNEARARAEWATDLMSHDLNNMHQGIMASLELILVDPSLPENIRRIAENALMQVNRSVSLIANVKKFSLVNKEDRVLEKTDPAQSLATAIEILKQSFPLREINVVTNITSDEYCIMANDFLQDVFYNILHNSVKATQTESVKVEVEVSLIEDGEFLRMDFIDWGEGINDRMKETILTGIDERIRRISGVGLTLVKQIIDLYSGKIWVEDRVKEDYSQGTRFVILLPHGC